MYLKFDEIVPIVFILRKKMITMNETACLTPRSCCYVLVAAAIAPYEYQGGILCSERGQSYDAFQATQLEETSPRCNKQILVGHLPPLLILLIDCSILLQISSNLPLPLSTVKENSINIQLYTGTCSSIRYFVFRFTFNFLNAMALP